MAETHAYGECPLSKDGLCEAHGECPYGCDEKARVRAQMHAAEQRLLVQHCPVTRLFKLLKQSAWICDLKAVNAPPAVIAMFEEPLHEAGSFATETDWERFHAEWDDFYRLFKQQRILMLGAFEVRLHEKYGPRGPQTSPN